MRADLAAWEADLRQDEEERPGDDSPPTGSRDAAKALTARSLLHRGRLSLLAFILGLGSVALSVTVVVSSLLETRDSAERRYRESTQLEVQMLASTIKLRISDPEQPLILALMKLHNRAHPAAPAAPDEHFVIINNRNSGVILDTAAPDRLYRPSPAGDDETSEGEKSPETKETRETIIAVHERMGTQPYYSGEFFDGNGLTQIGSFTNVSDASGSIRRNWLLGIFRSKDGLHASALQLGKFGALILFCGLAMPLSLLLMYCTYHLARRDQLRAEEARARLGAIVESSEDAIFSETFTGAIMSWNRGAEHVFGHTENEAIGRHSAELIPSERSAEERQIIAEVGDGENAGEHALETIRVRKDGKPIHVSQTISPIKDSRGRSIGVSIIARDITARRNLEREVLEITSREQQRIGRELHDSLGQELTGLSYLAKSLVQKLAAVGSAQGEMAQTIMSGVQRALREVRSAVQGLVPVEVDAAGFMVALEKLVDDTRARCGIDCRLNSPEAIRIDDNVLATHLYRIVQEAINNAVKHAQARQIVVRPESRNGTLKVTVQDDGVGIADQAIRNGGMGLKIMQYRAGVIDATLDVRTTDGAGTSVVCLVKTKRDESADETS